MQTTEPVFRTIDTVGGVGVTYECGCPCTPTAVPPPDGSPGFEHCCCGKVHFAGTDAESALTTYLTDRAARRKHEPLYTRGTGHVNAESGGIRVAWAFPTE